MKSPKFKGDRVYVVAWLDQMIVKVGYTGEARWRTRRGDQSVLHEFFCARAPLAFDTRAAAEPFLGTGGGGWCEAYRLSDWALLGALPGAPSEHCLENPDLDYYRPTPVMPGAMHVRTDERTYGDGVEQR